MGASLQERTLLVNLYYKNDNCARVVLQKFRTLKGIKKGVGPASVMVLKQMMQNFGTTGSFDVQPGRERKTSAFDGS